jgi:nicotinamide-nucleotide amidase
MAVGALKNSRAQIVASITGIAGPEGGTHEKPVGTVCFAWSILHQKPVTTTKQFHGSRDEIRQQAAMFIMAELAEKIAKLN